MNKLLLISLLGLAFSAHAGAYKCQDSSGRTVYQETPCEGASLKSVGTVKAPSAASDEERARMMGIEQKNKADADAALGARKKIEKAEEEKKAATYQRQLEERKAAATERQAAAAEESARAARERNERLFGPR